MSLLNERIDIGGRVSVLIPDEISAELPAAECILLDETNRSKNPLWVRESDVATIRASQPDAAVYGLWQTLLHSKVLDLSAPLLVYPTGERSGLFLQTENGVPIRSGRYAGNRTPHDVPHEPRDGAVVSFDAADLSAPSVAARLPKEIIAEESNRQRSRAVVGAVAGLAIVAVCGYIAWQRDEAAQQRQLELASVQRALASAQQTLLQAKANHTPYRNENVKRTQTMVYALDLVANSRHATIDTVSLGQAGFTASVQGLYAQPEWASEIRPTEDGAYAVTYDAAKGGR